MGQSLQDYSLSEYPLRELCASWVHLLTEATAKKGGVFQSAANDMKMFISGGKDQFFTANWARGSSGYASKDGSEGDFPVPDFQMIPQKISEAISRFAPAIYSITPDVQVTEVDHIILPPEALGLQIDPQNQQDPQLQMYQQMAQQISSRNDKNRFTADIIERIINHTQRKAYTYDHSRRAVDEALMTGEAVKWIGVSAPDPQGRRRVVNEYDLIERLLKDPDAKSQEEIKWISRTRRMAVSDVIRKWDLEDDALEEFGYDSQRDASSNSETGDSDRYMMVTEVYSKMGIGERIPSMGIDERIPKKSKTLDLVDNLEELMGDFVYMAIVEDVPFPLNLPPELLSDMEDEETADEIRLRLSWPIPTHAMSAIDNWPCTRLTYGELPSEIWGEGHFKKGMSYLHWLAWAMSFLAGKVRTSCQTTIGVLRAASDEVKDALASNEDNKLIELEQILGTKISDIVSYIQQPPFHGDIWNMVNMVFGMWDKAVGYTEIMTGQTTSQDRSATTSKIKNENSNIIISDMRDRVEKWESLCAAKEMFAMQYLLETQDVLPIVGTMGAIIYEKEIYQAEFGSIASQFNYTVAAGTTVTQNRMNKLQSFNEAVTLLGPQLGQLASSGIVGPMNALMGEWADLMQIDNSDRFMIPPPPPPQPPPPDPKAEAELAKLQAEMQMAQQAHQADMQKLNADLMAKKMDVKLKMQMAEEQARQSEENHLQALDQSEDKAQQELMQEERKAEQALRIVMAEADAKIDAINRKAEADAQAAKKKQSILGRMMGRGKKMGDKGMMEHKKKMGDEKEEHLDA